MAIWKSSAALSALWVSCALPVLVGCTAILDGMGSEQDGGSGVPGNRPGDGPGSSPGDADEEELSLLPHRIWRLTPLQYERSFVTAFGSTTKAAEDFRVDPRRNGFDDLAAQNHVDITWAENVRENAEAIAATLAPSLIQERPCFELVPLADECVADLVVEYAERAYRRPLAPEQEQSLVDLFFSMTDEENSTEQALAAVLEGIAQSPYFLYRIEIGDEEPAGVQRLDAYTLASQLAYMLTDAPPDESLLADAEDDLLGDPDVLLEHAERLLESPEALEKITRFFDQYLGTFVLAGEPLPKDTEAYPNYSAQIQAAMLAETHRFVERVALARNSTISDIFTSSETYIDDDLRAFYAWPGSASPEQPFVIPGGERGGIFLQASVLAARSPSLNTDPLHRGLFILERLLCQHVSPPADVDIFELADALTPPDPLATEREKLEYLKETNPGCGNCHDMFVSLGLGLEHFNAVGRYREDDDGRSIDPSGELRLGNEATLPYSDALDLFGQIGSSAQGQACFAENWLSFALGESFRVPVNSRLVRRFQDGGLRLRELLLLLTQDEAFFLRRVEAEP